MLPPKILELVNALRVKTDTGGLVWNYIDTSATVYIELNEFSIHISYRFDEMEEAGRFNIRYVNRGDNKEYFFTALQFQDSDYDAVRSLFDSAQSSDIKINLNF